MTVETTSVDDHGRDGLLGRDSVDPTAERPSRADLRRAREDGATASESPGSASSRAQLRAVREARDKRPNPLVVLLTAWWFYPLLLLLVVVVVLGWKSATTPKPSDRPVVVETVPAANS